MTSPAANLTFPFQSIVTKDKLPITIFSNDTDVMGASSFRMENVCIESAPGSFKYDGKIFYLTDTPNATSIITTQFGKTYDSFDRRYINFEPLPPHLLLSVESARAAANTQGYGSDGMFRMMNTTSPRINLVAGASVIPECYYQGNNPAHLLFGLSVLFEWGVQRPDSSSYRAEIPPFDHIGFFKCTEPHHYKASWNWADVVLNISMSSLHEQGLLLRNTTSSPYLSPERGEKVEQLYCFEQLYYTRRWGVLFALPVHLQQFQQRARVAYNDQLFRREPSALATENRCQKNKLTIKILLRGDSWFPRSMKNLKEVVERANNKTSGSVIVETTKAAVDFAGQWRVFNDFDILITSAGSHLTNMILTENKNVGFLEMGIIARDTFWQENALRLGFASYIVSSGHKPHGGPRGWKICNDDSLDLSFPDCNKTAGGAIFCPSLQFTRSVTECDYLVDLNILEKQLDQTIRNICGPHRYLS
jgi:hypothetical protein